ncbi:MAG: FG-GAP-like repeat-containing protein, partial [Prevotellaceae bacterium]|nr:FG-GAP-like repeat-containing protein [Prevotellaceae bacterium]
MQKIKFLALSAVLFFTSITTLFAQKEEETKEPTTISAMPASAAVSSSGAANYALPIEVPPGTNGFQPNISIAYNSQGGFGEMGIGWSISGLSAITRGTKSFYYDSGTIPNNAVTFTNHDQLYLDGQRLILLSGTHFQAGAVYGLEIENYWRITVKTSNSQLYFELRTLEGQILEYGKDNSSQLTGAGGTLSWKICKSTDVFGNGIDYYYSQAGRNIQLISYAGGENLIEFSYTSNTKNPQRRYIKNFYAVNENLLSNIITKNAGVNVKRYSLRYTASDTDNRLTEIRGYNWGKSDLTRGQIVWCYESSTNIGWGLDATLQRVSAGAGSYAWFANQNNSSLYSGDIDGDGYPDKIEFWTGDYSDSEDGFFRVYLKNGATVPAVNFSIIRQYEYNNEDQDYFSPNLVIGDIDRDGKDEIILIHAEYAYINIKVYSFNNQSNTLNLIDTETILMPDEYNEKYQRYQAFLINRNGDMYPDLTIVPYWQQKYGNRDDDHTVGDIEEAGNIITFTGRADGTLNPPSYTALDIESTSERGAWHAPLVGDFDSDGVPDILHALCGDPNDLSTFLSFNGFNVQTSKNWGDNLFYIASDYYDRKMFESLHPIDANNDGRTDILVHRNERYEEAGFTHKWHIFQSKGLDAMPDRLSTPLSSIATYSGPQNRYYPIVIDYNGDGMQDIILCYENFQSNYNPDIYYSYWTYFRFYKNNNGTFVEDCVLGGNSTRLSRMQPTVMDINNDGVQDLVFLENGNYYAFTMPNVTKRLLVHKITNGLGQTDEFSYKYNSSYEKPNGSEVRTLNVPMAVVNQHKQSNGETVQYVFEKAKYHKTKGFLGFEKTTATNITTGIKTVNEYSIGSFYHLFLQYQKTYV